MIRGFLVLLLCQGAGELLKALTQVMLPGPVLGMLVLLLALMLRGGIPEWLGETSARLIGILSLLFLPPAVGLFFLGPAFRDQWPAVIGAIVLGTFVTLAVTAALMNWLIQRREGRVIHHAEDRHHEEEKRP